MIAPDIEHGDFAAAEHIGVLKDGYEVFLLVIFDGMSPSKTMRSGCTSI